MTKSTRLGALVPGWAPPGVPGRVSSEGHYVRLEPLSTSHAADLHAAFAGSSEVWSFMPYGPFRDVAAYTEWVDEAASGEDPMFFAIIPEAAARPEGVASYLRIAPEAGSIEVGHIALSPALQRTRAATEAMYLMMRCAFEAGYRRYEWKCDALNRASRRAAERLGLSYEGVFRQAAVVKGRNRDTAWFAAIDNEWPSLRVAFETWLDPANFDATDGQLLRLSDLTHPILAARDPVLSSHR